MSKKSTSSSRPAKIRELEPAGDKKIPSVRFKTDLTIEDFRRLSRDFTSILFRPIETLTPGRTVGKGRTNLTIIESTIVQVDTTPPAPPFANFDKRLSQRNPAIQMHFDPGAYGFTAPATFIMEFTVSVAGSGTFLLAGGPTGLNITNGGVKTLNGAVRVSLVFHDLPPDQKVFGFLEQRSGGLWTWLQTQVKLPPLVLTPL